MAAQTQAQKLDLLLKLAQENAERITALENGGDAGVESVEDDDDTAQTTTRGRSAAQKPAATRGKSKANTGRGKSAKADVTPQANGNGEDKPKFDRNSPATLSQCRWAMECAHDYTHLEPRQTKAKDVTYWAGVKRCDENGTPLTATDRKLEPKYQELRAAVVHAAITAFNMYSGMAPLDPDSVTYGELWDWLDENAPVNAAKARAAQKARLDAKSGK